MSSMIPVKASKVNPLDDHLQGFDRLPNLKRAIIIDPLTSTKREPLLERYISMFQTYTERSVDLVRLEPGRNSIVRQ